MLGQNSSDAAPSLQTMPSFQQQQQQTTDLTIPMHAVNSLNSFAECTSGTSMDSILTSGASSLTTPSLAKPCMPIDHSLGQLSENIQCMTLCENQQTGGVSIYEQRKSPSSRISVSHFSILTLRISMTV